MTIENYSDKSTVQEIRSRFDADVERFSNLETGQQAFVDDPLVMELITRAAVATTAPIRRVLDIGCFFSVIRLFVLHETVESANLLWSFGHVDS